MPDPISAPKVKAPLPAAPQPVPAPRSWRDDAREDLRGRSLQEQEQRLSPDAAPMAPRDEAPRTPPPRPAQRPQLPAPAPSVVPQPPQAPRPQAPPRPAQRPQLPAPAPNVVAPQPLTQQPQAPRPQAPPRPAERPQLPAPGPAVVAPQPLAQEPQAPRPLPQQPLLPGQSAPAPAVVPPRAGPSRPHLSPDQRRTPPIAPRVAQPQAPGPVQQPAPVAQPQAPGPVQQPAPAMPATGANANGQPQRQAPRTPAEAAAYVHNDALADRVDLGARGVDFIIAGVDASQEALDKQAVARTDAIARNKEIDADYKKAKADYKKAKKEQAQKAKRGEEQTKVPEVEKPQHKVVPPSPRMKKHREAADHLAKNAQKMRKNAAAARTLPVPVPDTLIELESTGLEATAGKIAPLTDPEHVESTRDLAVGMRHGNQAMLDRLFSRPIGFSSKSLEYQSSLGDTNGKSSVYRANYLGIAPVGIKVSREDDSMAPEEDETVREAQTMHALRGGDNLLKGGTRASDKRAFVMQLASKGNLAQAGAALQSLPLSDRLETWQYLMQGGFTGLAGLHAKGLAHADVKNQNILLDDHYTPTLMDFGTTGEETTRSDSGTAAYMAPEVRSTGNANRASDVWSMGESLLFGLFGRNSVDFAMGKRNTPNTERFEEECAKKGLLADGAWLGKVEQELLAQAGPEAPTGPESDVGRVMDFLRKTMSLDPTQRLSSADALKHDFLKLKDGAKERSVERLKRARP